MPNQVDMTPSGWNSGVFNMIHNLSEAVIVPIGDILLTFVMWYNLVQMIVKKDLHDFDTRIF